MKVPVVPSGYFVEMPIKDVLDFFAAGFFIKYMTVREKK